MPLVELPAPGMRWETVSEHIARDMDEGRFPEKSERKQIPDEAVTTSADGRLTLLANVEQAVSALDPFNEGGATVHPEHGFRCGSDEASKANLNMALLALRKELETANG